MESKRRWPGCLLKLFVAFAIVLALFVYLVLVYPMWGAIPRGARGGPVPLTPAWALECWVWEDDVNTAAFTLELLEDYRANDFPVRTVLIDSPWSTRYNDFIVDEARFPEPAAFFNRLEDEGYRVVLWMTSMVNSRNPDTAVQDASDWHRDAADRGYLVGGDHQAKWWKGYGGFIDYTNPEAMAWWRGLQRQVLERGVDGWKLDGSATLLGKTQRFFWPYRKAHAGILTTRRYMDLYYREEYRHGLTMNPDFITMSRALDSPLPLGHPEGFAPLDAAPVNWVGDNKHTWDDASRGLERAVRVILDSAKLGYNVIGSDVGGYHGGGEIPPRLYIRWAQFSTFCGLFLNGGHGERRMSRRTPEELGIIREFSWLHMELVPYMFSHVVAGHEGGPPLMRPLDAKYHYLFGDALLVAPIYEDADTRAVTLPAGRWRYWFDDARVIEGPVTFTREFPLDEYPVYVRDGAIVPMYVERAYTSIGDRDWKGFLALNLYPDGGDHTFRVRHPDDNGRSATDVTMRGRAPLLVRLDGAKQPHILRVLAASKPAGVSLDGVVLDEGVAWRYDPESRRLIVRTTAYSTGEYEIDW
ncbi:MAG TPA: glycoside hydrolase family 31 protein [Candidatus Hydrogenedentes bacterium]|nr:glycoside hydrolase family 31 protein [Candidatus Hydrogenedentota bacterium]HNT86871.1 glycoside hydrolase family 31 protein [Candidatus Hydrogenedentota bacterium]